MASVYRPKGRGIYRIEFKDQHGLTRTASSGMKDRRCAEALAAKIEHNAQRLRAGMPADHAEVTGPYLSLYRAGRNWQEFREEYARRVLDGLAPASKIVAEECLDRFERLMKPATVAGITDGMVADFVVALRGLRGRKIGELASPATVNKNLRYLRAALCKARKWGYAAQSPDVTFDKEPRHLPRFITPEHFAAVYEACENATKPAGLPYSPAAWWRGLVVLLYMTGWRIAQALAFRRDALDLTAATVTAFSSAAENRGKRDTLIALHPLAVEHLRPLAGPGQVVFPWPHHRRTLDEERADIQEAAGIALPCRAAHEHTRHCHVYGFHDIRRAFATMNQDLPEPDQAVSSIRNPNLSSPYERRPSHACQP
jgi:integrase